MENALAKKSDLSLAEIQTVGDIFYKSGMFKDIQGASQAVVKVMAGKELGLSPIVSMNKLYMINGKVAMEAVVMSGLVKMSGKYTYKILEHTEHICKIEFFEVIDGKKESCGIPTTFTIDDAKRAGLTGKDVWQKYPKNMLFSRCFSNAVRWYCPELILGAYTPEELDIDVDKAVSVDATSTVSVEVTKKPMKQAEVAPETPEPKPEPAKPLPVSTEIKEVPPEVKKAFPKAEVVEKQTPPEEKEKSCRVIIEKLCGEDKAKQKELIIKIKEVIGMKGSIKSSTEEQYKAFLAELKKEDK